MDIHASNRPRTERIFVLAFIVVLILYILDVRPPLVYQHQGHGLSLFGNQSHSITTNGFGRIYSNCNIGGQFALTFDDGPSIYHHDLLEQLARHNIEASFFVNGNNRDMCIYDQAEHLQRAYLDGHLIGSHTWSHVDVSRVDGERLNEELDQLEEALKKILGIKPKWFRPPYGRLNMETAQVLLERGYNIVTWSASSLDGRSLPEDSIAVYDRLALKFPVPQMSLNHETKEPTVFRVVPYAIQVLQNAGYGFSRVDHCNGIYESPYEIVGPLGNRDETWTCS